MAEGHVLKAVWQSCIIQTMVERVAEDDGLKAAWQNHTIQTTAETIFEKQSFNVARQGRVVQILAAADLHDLKASAWAIKRHRLGNVGLNLNTTAKALRT